MSVEALWTMEFGSGEGWRGDIFREGYASMDARLRWRSDLPTGVA